MAKTILSKGIDVSYANGKIDWSVMKNHVDWVIFRVGYGSNYASQDDAQFENNIKGCEKYGIPYGVYLYSYADTVEKAKSEAEHCIRLLKGLFYSLCCACYGFHKHFFLLFLQSDLLSLCADELLIGFLLLISVEKLDQLDFFLFDRLLFWGGGIAFFLLFEFNFGDFNGKQSHYDLRECVLQ